MSLFYCKGCAHFECEVMGGDGEPLDFVGMCLKRHNRKEADDYCNDFKKSKWAKMKESEVKQ